MSFLDQNLIWGTLICPLSIRQLTYPHPFVGPSKMTFGRDKRREIMQLYDAQRSLDQSKD